MATNPSDLMGLVASGGPNPYLASVQAHIATGALALGGLITHRREAAAASDAYQIAFEDSTCLKMVLDWRTCS